MSIIAAGTSSGTALVSTGDTNGTLVIQTNGTTVAATFGTDQKLTLAGALVTTGVSTFAAGSAAAPSITTTGDTNTGIFFPAADTIGFSEGGAEAMRIDSSGNLLVGRTAQTPYTNVGFTVTSSGRTEITRVTGGDALAFYVSASGNNVGTIVTNASSTSYNTSSDYRLKENIAPITGALGKVAQLKPCTYKWKVDGTGGEGFIAHELQSIVPDCVTGEKDGVETYTDEDGNEQTRPKYQGIDTSFLVATLTAAIQELKAIIDTQAAQIAALNAKVGI